MHGRSNKMDDLYFAHHILSNNRGTSCFCSETYQMHFEKCLPSVRLKFCWPPFVSVVDYELYLFYTDNIQIFYFSLVFNPLNAKLNPICYLLALLAHHFIHVSRIRIKSLNLRLLMSYIYGAPILDISRSHTTTQHFGRTPLDERSARRRDLNLTTHDTRNRQISMPPVGFERTSWSLVQRSPTDCGASLCVI